MISATSTTAPTPNDITHLAHIGNRGRDDDNVGWGTTERDQTAWAESTSRSAARWASPGTHRPAAALARTCSGLVAPAITEDTASLASSAPMATSVSGT